LEIEMYPKARIDSLIVQEIDDETLVYDRKNGKAHCLNSTAAIVWRHCDGAKSLEEIAILLASESAMPADEDLVWLALDRLQKAKLLDGPLARPARGALISRREVGRRLSLATGVAIALPVVLSLVAPTAAMAASNVPIGGRCTTSSECVPGSQGPCCRNGFCSNGAGNCS
jgi:hypothetical protein